MQNLTFKDNIFDICTSTEVFEHVANDIKGFSEIYSVLKKNGLFLFTAPLSEDKDAIERARLNKKGNIVHLLKEEYHDDSIRGKGTVLCYRNYDKDIIKRLNKVGFKYVKIMHIPGLIG